jgi:hypothetical protein
MSEESLEPIIKKAKSCVYEIFSDWKFSSHDNYKLNNYIWGSLQWCKGLEISEKWRDEFRFGQSANRTCEKASSRISGTLSG